MKKDRFTIEIVPHSSIAWQVKDNVSGLGILFYEGVFFPNKVLLIPDSLKGDDKKKELYHIADEIVGWVQENALDMAVCNESARCRAIWLLNDSHSLAVIIQAIKGISPNDVDMSKASDTLFDKVEHYVLMGDGEDEFCFDQEISRLLGVVSMLSDKEAMELFCMASIYWNYKVKAGIDIGDFADDLLLWPVRLSREQQAEAMGNDSKVIEAEGFELEEEKEEK